MLAVREAAFELLDADRDGLGEGPWWSVSEQRLYWVDITGRRVRSSDLDGNGLREWSTPAEVGFVVPDVDGQLVVGLTGGLARLDPVSGAILPGVEVDSRADHRLNDGKTDRAGRIWFGSMHRPETEAVSRFYRVDGAGVKTVFDDIITSNGLGWSPDNATMYYTDSKTWQIRAFDFDAISGTMSNPRVFASDPEGEFVPDGLTVDAEGCVWGAKWQGSRVVRYAPDGRIILDLRFPVARMTSCMFAGAGLDTLVVTSARGEADDEALAGRVFLVDPGVKGIAETPVPARVLAAALGATGVIPMPQV
ncbi:MAG: SMP-30/gluconolactonase/LRE family protein [Propionibacteriaceae bacterium]|nr:SMP-30/gluconolactonase/LRE family protein [Propionibacteriaceae bacterium]